jgi:hypothetical protein
MGKGRGKPPDMVVTEYCANNRTKILLFSNAWFKENSVFKREAVGSSFGENKRPKILGFLE